MHYHCKRSALNPRLDRPVNPQATFRISDGSDASQYGCGTAAAPAASPSAAPQATLADLYPQQYLSADPTTPLFAYTLTSATCGDFRAHAGRIAEENRARAPVASSTRRSLTRGALTGTAPAAVLTSRAAW